MDPTEDRSEIVFFDVETTVPTQPGQGFAILEFGAILVCPRKLTELDHYSTLVRPADLSLISPSFERSNGISYDTVASAPTFSDVAEKVYDLLHGRIWAGHNVIRCDCIRIRDAFAQINQPAPEPKGTIDSWVLLTQRFGRRAGDMKLATLATYFGLGRQTHRSLDDARMNLEVLKRCATVLFLESSLPDVFTENHWISPNATTRSRSNGKWPSAGCSSNMTKDSSSPVNQNKEDNHPVRSLTMCCSKEAMPNIDSTMFQPDSFNTSCLIDEMKKDPIQSDVTENKNPMQELPKLSSLAAVSDAGSSSIDDLDPDEICIPYITASLIPYYRGSQRIELLHKGFPFQLCSSCLKVRFGIRTKFFDHAGRPRLSFVVDPSPRLCEVLDACDIMAQRLSLDSGSSSNWKPVVTRKDGFFNYPTVRLHIPTAVCGNIAIYATEIYQRESSGTEQRLLFSKFDAAELNLLFVPGTLIDALFSLDPYDYQQNAGIRVVAKKLIIHCK